MTLEEGGKKRPIVVLVKPKLPARVDQIFLHVDASLNPKSETCPGPTCWLGKTDSGWHEGVYSKQEQGLSGQLLRWNAPRSHPLCVCVFLFSVFLGWVCHLPETPTQQRYCLSDKRLNRLLDAYGATTASATAL